MNPLISGTAASLASMAALAAGGRRELGDGYAPINAPSQWVWGRSAPYRNGFSLRHTVVGYAIHHLASIFWALLFVRIARRRNPLVAAASTAALSGIVDFKLTPERFKPGFQKRLSRPTLVLAYTAFALGLAATAFEQRNKSLRRP